LKSSLNSRRKKWIQLEGEPRGNKGCNSAYDEIHSSYSGTDGQSKGRPSIIGRGAIRGQQRGGRFVDRRDAAEGGHLICLLVGGGGLTERKEENKKQQREGDGLGGGRLRHWEMQKRRGTIRAGPKTRLQEAVARTVTGRGGKNAGRQARSQLPSTMRLLNSLLAVS